MRRRRHGQQNRENNGEKAVQETKEKNLEKAEAEKARRKIRGEHR